MIFPDFCEFRPFFEPEQPPPVTLCGLCAGLLTPELSENLDRRQPEVHGEISRPEMGEQQVKAGLRKSSDHPHFQLLSSSGNLAA